MIVIFLCVVSYAIFIASDFLKLYRKNKLSIGFFIGGIVLLTACFILTISASDIVSVFEKTPVFCFAMVILASFFMYLLLHSLFFALPANETYIKSDDLKLVNTGIYALCRHPGVIFLTLFFLFAWLAAENKMIFWLGITSTVLDIIFVTIQDIYIFPKTIESYNEYKKYTPFIIPNIDSIKRAVKTRNRRNVCEKGEMMRFEEKLKNWSSEEIWEEYCGFLDLSIEEYMQIQERLLLEQIEMFSKCGLGRKLFGENAPKSLNEFRANVPLTQYEDYSDVLLMKRTNMLPSEPLIWLQTTWEGGSCPAKVAPYSVGMLETCKKNGLATMILASTTEKGKIRLRRKARILYNLAPLPFVTGIITDLIDPEIEFNFLPSLKDASKMMFSEKIKRGFELGIQGGIHYLYGVSSILHGMSQKFDMSPTGSLLSLFKMSPKMLFRVLSAKYRSKRDNKPILPKDLFKLESLVCAGADSARYKDGLEEIWGIRPLELAGGTESTCLGVETWSKNGLVFFPDACFYEFIPENEMMRSLKYPSYQPHTYLINEVVANQNYELVITVLKGGAFARYRIGDVYRCLRVKNKQDGLDIPQFEYIDRIPPVIDIAGFTRITEREIATVIELSCLPIKDWFALKEYDDNNHSYLHIYLEAGDEAKKAVIPEIIKEHMNVYFRYYDGDYKDLKKLLGVDPLKVTLLKSGTIKKFSETYGVNIQKINPSRQEVIDMIHLNGSGIEGAVLACQ